MNKRDGRNGKRQCGEQGLNKARLERERKKEVAPINFQNDNYRFLAEAHRGEKKTAVRTKPNISLNAISLA